MLIRNRIFIAAFTAHCFFVCGLSGQDTHRIYLSGRGMDDPVDWEFFCTSGRRSGEWTTIPVPSNWELQGFGEYNYGHNRNKANEQGLYRHNFTVPSSWKGKTVRIVFQGVMTDAEVKINGNSTGPIHQGGFYEFRFDITRLLNYGKNNLLEVKVSKVSSNPSVEAAERQGDYWVFGGIYRPVFLEALPAEFIDRVSIDARAGGFFRARVHTVAVRKADRLECRIYTSGGQPLGLPFGIDLNKRSESSEIESVFTDVLPWSPEYPDMYMAEFRLMENGRTIHRYPQKFGFRTVEVRLRDGIYVNGRKIMFRGVNRHSFYPSSGRCLSRDLSIMDVNLMKDMNMNAVRMSHYPPDDHFLEACDSLGLFVINELAGWQEPPYDTEVGRKLVYEMLRRDVNHPSIILWSNGNEGGNNHELVDDYAKHDLQQRKVIHPWAVFRGLDTQHYRPFNYGTRSFYQGTDIFFPTEFLHGLYDGGHGAGLEDNWEWMCMNPYSAGAFLWVFSDEGVVRTDKQGIIDTDGNHAPDGILGPYREKEGSFYTIKEIWSPVQFDKKILPPSFDGTLQVENRFHFTSLDQCLFRFWLSSFPGPFSGSHRSTEKKTVTAPSLQPGEKGSISLDLPDDWKQYDFLYLSAIDPHGREIYTWSWPVGSPAGLASGILLPAELTASELTYHETDMDISVKTDRAEFLFSKPGAILQRVTVSGEEIPFGKGPVLASGEMVQGTIKTFTEGGNLVIEAFYEKGFSKLKWTVRPDGWLKLEYAWLPVRGNYDYLGIGFSLPEEYVRSVRWLGKGPYRVWKNRMKGVEFNVWEKAYNNTVTGESWDYPEFKGYHSDLYWIVLEDERAPITIVSATENLFLHLFTPDPPAGANNDFTSPPFPETDISLLHAISPIGTKFQKAETTGPSGVRNMFYPNRSAVPFSGEVYFFFGRPGSNHEGINP